jgi:glycosyltransferase involved in cell wall biosynthesis
MTAEIRRERAPRRVLFLLEALDLSGVVFAAWNLAEGLADRGVQLLVLARKGGARAEAFRRPGAEVLVDPWAGRPLLGRRALRAVRAFRPEIVHAQSTDVLSAAMHLGHATRAPVVATANRLEAEDGQHLAAHETVGIVAVSEAIRERLANKAGILRDRIRVIPNGLALDRLPAPAFDQPADARHVPAIGTYGTLRERKGQRIFLRAAAALLGGGTDAEFVILGEGPDKAALRRLAREAGIARRVTFHPSSPQDARHIAALDILVEPSYQEGLGLSVLQAMALGVPVVASGVGGIYSLVEDGETGTLVPRGDPEALAGAIRELLATPERRREQARHARELVEARFDIRRLVPDLLAFYRERLPETDPSGES